MCDKNEDSKRLKITLSFTRRYLGNRESYRDKRKSILKGENSRFQRSLVDQAEVIILGVTAVQSFANFNRVRSNFEINQATNTFRFWKDKRRSG